MDQDELQALGLYDPSDQHAGLRLQLLNYLVDLGATADDLVAYKDMLPGLAGVLIMRGGPVMTLSELVERSGWSSEDVRHLVRVAGFPDPDPDARIFTEGFATLISQAGAAIDVLGQETLYQLVRVMGSAMAKVADAAISAFLVNIEPAARRGDPVGLGIARANVEATSLLPLVPPTLDVLFRQHLLAAQRTVLADEDLVGYEAQHLVVGFVDLVGSTELSEQVSLSDLGATLSSFETLAMDTVTAGGGRVVKLIGDEVLFTAPDARRACLIALELAEACERDELVPAVRSGLAGGKVMLRDGDVFGPVVNAAARIVKFAQPGEVVVTTDVAEGGGLAHVTSGRHQLKGIAAEIELATLVRQPISSS